MSQLSSLLEKHRQLEQRSAFKSHYDLQQPNCKTNENFNFKSQPNITNSQSVAQNYSNNCGNGKVYVNPNYEQKNLRIHINPRLNLKSSIHVNPKLIHNMNNNPNPVNFPDIGKDICQPPSMPDLKNKRLVHINPKLMNKLICDAPESNITNHSTPSIINVEHPETIPVAATNLDSECLGNSQINLNLKNVAPVSESAVETNSMEDIEIIEQKINKTYFNTKIKKVNSSNYIIHSKTKLVKKSTPKNKLNSSIIILSKRKLVRMKKNPAKPISPVKKSPKKLKIVKKCLLSKPTISPKALNFSEIQDDQRLKLNRIKSQMKGNKIQKSYV